MKYTVAILLAMAALFISSPLAAQQQPEKSPEEMAIEEADRLEKELMLNGAQLFYVDSVLRANFLGLQDDMEMKENGMIRVSQTAYSGCKITISGAVYYVKSELSHARFVKERGDVKVDAY